MKRMICILLTVLLLLCGCTEQAAPDKKQETQKIPALPSLQGYDLYAGFARADITPEAPVPLAGYGNTEKRISRNVLDPLYVDALALTDAQGNTVLLMNWDGTRSYTQVQELARQSIAEATGVDVSRIYIGATHSHSAPEMTNQKVESAAAYSTYVVEQATAAARAAMIDRKPANMFVGTTEVEGLNFVRHYTYVDEQGNTQYFGDNFGTWVFDDTTKQAGQADATMYMLRFERLNAEPIALVNWRAHPHLTGGSSLYDISADWVGAFRDAVQYQTGAKVIYFNGASGNINEKSRINAENRTTDHAQYGAMLAQYAIPLLQGELEQVKADTIATKQTLYSAPVNHNEDSRYFQAKEIISQYTATGTYNNESALGYGIRSQYHANAIISNYNREKTMDLELNAILLGDQVCLVTAPAELFDTNAVWLEENSPVDYTLTLGYTNGHFGYIPSAQAWEYTCYETDISYFESGTAEVIQQCFLDMLNEMTQ